MHIQAPATRWSSAAPIHMDHVAHPTIAAAIETLIADDAPYTVRRMGRIEVLVAFDDFYRIEFVLCARTGEAAKMYYRTTPDQAIAMYARQAMVM